ncbi:MAG: NAD-binding protein [Planctomycetaceae bacterium]|nr:NAD-binding protein [Planctomycetaceae bacterium]
MRKILITGGAGFIGFHLAYKLLDSDYQIDLIDDFSRGIHDRDLTVLKNNKKVNLINANLLDTKIIDQCKNDYSYIYHLAAIIGVQNVVKSPLSVLEHNFVLLQNSLSIATKQKDLRRFVFASSSEVYGGTLHYHGLKFPTPENTPLTITELSQPRTSYMLSKVYGEAMCSYSSLPVTIMRPHNFYGPRMGMAHVIPELMKKVIDTDDGFINVPSIEHKRTFCYIKDAVQLIQLLAENPKTLGETYNIGNEDEEITMGELAEKIIVLMGKNIKVNPLPPTVGSPRKRIPDMSKSNKIINYKKQYSLTEGLRRTLGWYSVNVLTRDSVYIG